MPSNDMFATTFLLIWILLIWILELAGVTGLLMLVILLFAGWLKPERRIDDDDERLRPMKLEHYPPARPWNAKNSTRRQSHSV